MLTLSNVLAISAQYSRVRTIPKSHQYPIWLGPANTNTQYQYRYLTNHQRLAKCRRTVRTRHGKWSALCQRNEHWNPCALICRPLHPRACAMPLHAVYCFSACKCEMHACTWWPAGTVPGIKTVMVTRQCPNSTMLTSLENYYITAA